MWLGLSSIVACNHEVPDILSRLCCRSQGPVTISSLMQACTWCVRLLDRPACSDAHSRGGRAAQVAVVPLKAVLRLLGARVLVVPTFRYATHILLQLLQSR